MVTENGKWSPRTMKVFLLVVWGLWFYMNIHSPISGLAVWLASAWIALLITLGFLVLGKVIYWSGIVRYHIEKPMREMEEEYHQDKSLPAPLLEPLAPKEEPIDLDQWLKEHKN